ncbi:hypothetical protein ACSSS7_006751 [Eimeria intestinalis]
MATGVYVPVSLVRSRLRTPSPRLLPARKSTPAPFQLCRPRTAAPSRRCARSTSVASPVSRPLPRRQQTALGHHPSQRPHRYRGTSHPSATSRLSSATRPVLRDAVGKLVDRGITEPSTRAAGAR